MKKRNIEYRDIEVLYRELENDIDLLNENIDKIAAGVKQELKDMKKEGRNQPNRYASIIKKSKSENRARREGYDNRFERDPCYELSKLKPNLKPYKMKKQKRIEKRKFENSSYQSKKKLEIQLQRALIIVAAKNASAFNIQKEYGKNNEEFNKDIYEKKHKQMRNFLIRVKEYNNLVTEQKQIYYGFCKDNKGQPVLAASLPGYTRFSLHFGDYKMFQEDIQKVNSTLKVLKIEKRFPIKSNGKETIEELMKNGYAYELPIYTYNTGLINSDNYNNANKYAEEFKKIVLTNTSKVSETQLKRIIRKYKYNNREVMFLAEKMEFGKTNLIKISQLLDKFEKSFFENLKNRKIKTLKTLEKAIDEEREKQAYYNKINRTQILDLDEKDIEKILFTKDNKFRKQKSINEIEFYANDETVENMMVVLARKIKEEKREDIQIEDYILKRSLKDDKEKFSKEKIKRILAVSDRNLAKRILELVSSEISYEEIGDILDELLDEKIKGRKKTDEINDFEDVLDVYIQMEEIAKNTPVEKRKEAKDIEEKILQTQKKGKVGNEELL